MTLDGKSKVNRWLTIITGFVFTIYGFRSVYMYRDGSLPVREIAPAYWYLVASGPALIALIMGLVFSHKKRCWQLHWPSSLLIIIILLSQMHIPIIYSLYFQKGS